MEREWKPGDVATARINTWRGRVFRTGNTWTTDDGDAEWTDEYVSELRPLAVIDPEDREQVERLVRSYYSEWADLPPAEVDLSSGEPDAMQAALREFANPTPPKPDEPTGLWSVVTTDSEGDWIRVSTELANPWLNVQTGRQHHWDGVPAVRVLSEGVSTDA